MDRPHMKASVGSPAESAKVNPTKPETRRASLVFISWAPFCSRSDSIAKRLGGVSYMVYAPFWGSRYLTIALKYTAQTWRTLRLLWRERPRAVFVMTPPVTACFPAWLYGKLTGAPYVIDAHSGAFLDARWQSTLFLHRFFSRRAKTTLVTNEYLQNMVRAWGARTTIVSDVPVCFAEPGPVHLQGAVKMTLINTFTRDEPLEIFLRAAAELPDIQFYVTGPLSEAKSEVLSAAPKNVEFTGYLPDQQFVGLLLGSDAMICLTTLHHTMQRGAYESVYLGKPVVMTNTELLRKAFAKGCVHVENTVADIVRGVRDMQANLDKYRTAVQSLRLEKLETWSRTEIALRALLEQPGDKGSPRP